MGSDAPQARGHRTRGSLFGEDLHVAFWFQSNREYVRRVLEKQRDLRLADHAWKRKGDLPGSWPSYQYQHIANADGVPSEEIVDLQQGSDAKVTGEEVLARARQLAVELRKAS